MWWYSDLLIPLLTWGTCWLCFLYFGWPQPSEGAATIRRLLWVTAILALIAASPAVAWAALRIAPFDIEPSLWLCIAASAVGIGTARSSVWTSAYARPQVDDEEVLSRVDAIAHSMDIAPPSTQVERALEVVDNTPMWIAHRRVAELQQELASFEQAATAGCDRPDFASNT